MHIVITGVAGFIGFHLAQRLLANGHTVHGVDSFLCGHRVHVERLQAMAKPYQFTFYEGSAHDSAVAEWFSPETIVVHLAGLSALASNQENPVLSYTNNVAVTAGVLEHCRVKGVKHFIFASTSAVYEHTKQYPSAEDMVVAPDLLYSLGKWHGEELIRSFHGLYHIPYTIFRFFNVYGPHQDCARTHPPLLPYVIDCFRRGVTPVLHSDGTQQRDYVHVEDVVRLMESVMGQAATNDVYNVCTGVTVSVQELVTAIQAELHTRLSPVYRPAYLLWEKSPTLWTGERSFPLARMEEEVNKFSRGDPRKARERLGFEASITWQEGIRKLCSAAS